MRSWTRAVGRLSCGYAGCPIAAGEPYLMIAGPTWRSPRCVTHAGEPVDEDALLVADPEAAERERQARDYRESRGWTHAGTLPLGRPIRDLDGKARAAGPDRDGDA